MKHLLKMKRITFKKLIACILSISILLQAAPLYAFADEVSTQDTNIAYFPKNYGDDTNISEETTDEAASENNSVSSLENVQDTTDDSTSSNSELITNETDSTTESVSQTVSTLIENTEEENTDFNVAQENYFEGEKIKIYNEKQLKAIGTDAVVKSGDIEDSTFGTGEEIIINESALAYTSDAQYILMNDISLSAIDNWCLPENFTGSFTAKTDKSENPILYDESSDTIYIYSNYQLMILSSENSENEPVMTGDTDASTFGMGQFLYPDGTQDGQNYITYSKTHKYVLSQNFTSEMPELKANLLLGEANDGRDFSGQVIYHDDAEDMDYILIGNEDQLRAIGSGKNVYTAVYQAKWNVAKAHWEIDVDSQGNPIMLYGGDADLTVEQNGNKDYSFQNIDDADGELLETVGRCGVNQSTGEIDPNMYIDNSGKKYDADENYIIFRDITLTDDWTPKNFNGVMVGRENMVEGMQPTISNINIALSGELDTQDFTGIGFFGTLANSTELAGSEVRTGKQVVVKDLIFDNVSVNASYTGVKDNFSLLGILVGTILAGLDLAESLNSDPTTFATGAFAGRIVGNVVVSNCQITNLNGLSNSKNTMGGFVGSISGNTIFALEGISEIVNLLQKILNIIPFLGVGDLIGLLLGEGGVIPVGNLIPLAYENPQITGCSVEYSSALTSIGEETNNFIGGFAGRVDGAYIDDCQVLVSENSLRINGKDFVGGFAGSVVNGQIQGALEKIADLISFNPHSVVTNCKVNESGNGNVYVSASGSYVGGFTGTLNSSYLVDVTVGGLAEVKGEKYVGGIAGYSTVGWASTLGEDYGSLNSGLLGFLGGVLGGVVGGTDPSKESSLLSLAGAFPSKILGATINGNNLTISADDSFAGGFVGHGDGLTIAKSDDAHVNELRPIETSKVVYVGQGNDNTLTGLLYVSAQSSNGEKQQYAGGVAGRLAVASGAGVLNSTLGLTSYINFEISDVSVTGAGDGYTVSSKNYAGGAFGEAIGGTIDNVTLNNISSVEAENYSGGFIGATGTGSLVNGGGLDLLGLGLIEIDNLLSIADAIETKIDSSSVKGTNLTVAATGSGGDQVTYYAGGFVAYSACASIDNSSVEGLKKVSADNASGVAGGFAGMSTTAGLAEVAGENGGGLEGILAIDGLLSAVTYMVPDYNLCTVAFVSNLSDDGEILPQVEADIAGGFAGDFQSGHINDEEELVIPSDYTAVSDIEQVKGGHYAGGFVGTAYAGGLAEGGGLSLLSGIIDLSISNLLSVLNVYMPIIKNSPVKSSNAGLKVEADTIEDSYAGGYIGFGSGVQISDSPVDELRHTVVKEPGDLEAKNISSYYDGSSDYAVIAGEYAGGYAGLLDIGNTANLVDSISALEILDIGNLTQALAVTASNVKGSSVNGTAGGYSVLASTSYGSVGYAGGYAGGIYGSKVTNSDANNFAYIIGRDSAGGYVGTMEPGNVAKVIEHASVLNGLVSVSGGLASVLETFVPFVENSNAISIPCGSAVRAEKESDGSSACGTAGGFVGHSIGGQIDTCQAIRIRSVFGSEYAGGFTGWAEGANIADTGSFSLLYGAVSLNNPLQVAEAVYPTEKNTRVSGPMTDLDFDTWDIWASAVGVSGAYGSFFYEYSQKDDDEREAIYEERKNNYACGFNVEAGRDGNISSQRNIGGDAGGYVGRLDGAYIENAVVDSVANVRAYRTAGGFVGNMRAGSVANAGGISLAGINILDNLSLIEAFVPVIKGVQVNGFVSGLSVEAYGITEKDSNGSVTGQTAGRAGGFAGYIVGGQISGIEDDSGNITKNTITNLRKVNGTSDVGGFAGSIESGSALDLNTDESGLLNKILKYIINSDELVSVLNATVSTVKDVEISSWNNWGITVNGYYSDSVNKYTADTTGGFAGSVSGAIIGTQEENIGVRGVTISGLREVYGGEHAGGFVGLADVGSLVNLSDDSTTSILSIIKLGNTSLADMFRTYIYDSHVSGSKSYGLTVTANISSEYGTMDSKVYTGNAGGFAGSFMNSTVEDSDVTELRAVYALNGSGGFIGYSGKSGLVDLDQVSVGDTGNSFSLLNGAVGVLDVFGSTVDNCKVTGVESGFMVSSADGTEEKAGGFVGFGDLSRISNSNVDKLKQVASSKIAGGFAGETSFAYLADIKLSSALTETLVIPLLNGILKLLKTDKLTQANLIKIDLGIIEADLLYDGSLVYVDLLGLKISVKLEPGNTEGDGVLVVAIGDSSVRVNYNNWQVDKETADITVSLIKANRTKISNCSVTGISYGYDVYAGGSGNDTDAVSGLEESKGSSGGFVGYNNEGLLENNNMYLCDVVKGKDGEVGPFTGKTSLESVYDFNTIDSIEGNNNIYRVYRHADGSYPEIKNDVKSLQSQYDGSGSYPWNNIYTINHIKSVERFTDFQNAKLTDGENTVDANVYASGAKAVLMGDVDTNPDDPSEEPLPPDIQDPCEDEYVKLTIHNIWDDWTDYDGIRPESITINIVGTIEDHDDLTINKEIVLDTSNAVDTDNIWSYNSDTLTFKGYELDKNGNRLYYTYSVEYTTPDGYVSTTRVEDYYNFYITHYHRPDPGSLPGTGGSGISVFNMVGILFLGGFAFMTYLKYKNKRKDLKNRKSK